MVTTTNPVPIQINGDSNVAIVCNSHAAYFQRVTLTWTVLRSTIKVVFSGSGKMTTEEGATGYKFTTQQGIIINALFEYSPNGSVGPFTKAVVQQPIRNPIGDTTIITVTSEDSNDQDNNDSYLIIAVSNL